MSATVVVDELPEIEAPARFFPDPILVEAPQTRWLEDGYGEIRWADGRREYAHPMSLHIIEALEEGLGFAAIVESLPAYDDPPIPPSAVPRLARRFLWKLAKNGHVRFPLEEPPEVFEGRYRRVREIGRGGMGIVHLCEDLKQPGRQVAIKHPWGMRHDVRDAQAALGNEMRILQAMDHPALPALHDGFAIRGLLHMVRDYVEGESLHRMARGSGLRDTQQRCSVALQIADLVQHVHDRGYLFHDMRPANFIVTSTGRVSLVDVGRIGKREGDHAQVKGMQWSPGYVAPEMREPAADGFRYPTTATDVHTFGRVYFFLLTGRDPGRSWDYMQLLASLRKATVHPADAAVVEQCCNPDPQIRPRLDEVRTTLEQINAGSSKRIHP